MSESLIRGVLGAPWKRPRHVASEALGEAHLGWVSEAAGRNASEPRAGLESEDASADPPELRRRPLRRAEQPRWAALRLAGGVGAARGEGLLGNVGGPFGAAGRDCRRRESRRPRREAAERMGPGQTVKTAERRR